MTLCIGMSALHYFLAGRRPFNEVLQIQEAPEAPRFKADVQDAWAGAFDAQKVTDWQPGMPLEEIEYRPHQSPRSVQPGTRRPTHRLTPPRTTRPTPCPSSTTAPAAIA